MTFKGTEVGIVSVDIRADPAAGVTVGFKVHFRAPPDAGSRVHGEIVHLIPAAGHPTLAPAVSELIKVLTDIATEAHFERPAGDAGQKDTGHEGIAEALSAPVDPSDRVARQG